MKGIFQTLVQRAVSSGLYFPLEDIFRSQLDLHLGEKYEGHRSLHNLLSGTLAGLHLGLIMNPFVSVRVGLFSISTSSNAYREKHSLIISFILFYSISITIGARPMWVTTPFQTLPKKCSLGEVCVHSSLV